jgi:hypothetical protein
MAIKILTNWHDYPKAKGPADVKPNTIYRSWLEDKKLVVRVVKGDKEKLIHFGHAEYSNYGVHNSKERLKNYLTRSAGIRNKDGKLTKDDPFSANYWARRVLWNPRAFNK